MPSDQRRVLVDPSRLAGWLERFTQRHGAAKVMVEDDALTVTCPDQAQAVIALIWGPLPPGPDPLALLVQAYTADRRVLAVIVRRRAHAVGVFDGLRLVEGHHDHHYVQGRTKAGGWSQQRYARRRANQADRAYEKAADDIVSVGLGNGLQALVTAGDRSGINAVLSDPRLAPLASLPHRHVGGIGDPNATVLTDFGRLLRQAPISVNEFA